MRSARVWSLLLLLAMTALLLRVRGDVDRVPPSEPLSELPQRIGDWHGVDVAINPEIVQIMGKGIFLNRLYEPGQVADNVGGAPESTLRSRASGSVRPVGLFIGYFPTQRTGQSIHSPQNCLPGSGWVFESRGRTQIPLAGGGAVEAGEFLISNGTARSEVLYWYRAHGRSIASDYRAKLFTLLDSIRYGRTDAALIRIITPVNAGEPREQARQRAVSFAAAMSPLLPSYIPD